MKSFRLLTVACLLALAPLGHAQDSSAPAASDLKGQMSASEFKAAGLDKLSADELAALNTWLDRKVGAQTAAAVAVAREETRAESAQAVAAAKEEGRQEVVTQNRGFFDFGTKEPIEANLQGEFRGFGKGQTYTLDNGQVWEQTDSATMAGVRKTNPQVSIKPGALNVWYMKIKGYNTTAKVRRIK